MSSTNQAATFRALHNNKTNMLILPNAWDACSAALMRGLGAQAVATTSAGLAWALGYPDGNAIPIELHASSIRQIVRVVTCPVSADVEGGYSDNPQQAAENIMRIIEAGAVGINMEDGHGSPDLLCRKIEAVKLLATQSGIDVFVNARTDVYLKRLATGQELSETLRRSALYKSAGADGLFVPAVVHKTEIAALANDQSLPLNVMAVPSLLTRAELAELGVRRLSAGSGLAQKVWAAAKQAGSTFLNEGCTDSLFSDALTFGELNALFGNK